MAWRSASSDEPVTVALLIARKVSLDLHAAVAIVLEIAEVFERSGQGALPAYQHLAITPTGSVEFLRGRTEKGHPVKVLAQMLNTLLPRDRPTQLRLIVSTAGPEGASYTSVAEFSEALKYFERPGRQNVIADIYVRARATPPLAEPEEFKKEAETDRRKRPLRLRRFAVPVAAVLVSGVAVAAGIAYLEHRDPGSVSTRAGSLQDVASGAWDAALGVSGTVRPETLRPCSSVCAGLARMTPPTRRTRPTSMRQLRTQRRGRAAQPRVGTRALTRAGAVAQSRLPTCHRRARTWRATSQKRPSPLSTPCARPRSSIAAM